MSLDRVGPSVFSVTHPVKWTPQLRGDSSPTELCSLYWDLLKAAKAAACQDAPKSTHSAFVRRVLAGRGPSPIEVTIFDDHSSSWKSFSVSRLQQVSAILSFVLWWPSAQVTETISCLISSSFFFFFSQSVFSSSNLVYNSVMIWAGQGGYFSFLVSKIPGC